MMHKREWTVYHDEQGHKMLILLDPIYNEPDCYTAACHAHPEEDKVIGVLVSNASLDPLDEIIEKNTFFITILIILVVAAVAAILSTILWFIVLKPITALSEGMKRVSSGDLAFNVAISSKDEIGRLAQTFNKMTDELRVAREKMEQWTESLEDEVEKKTRKIRETQDKLIQAEKLAALGRLTADIAHEIRNPLTVLGGFGRRLLTDAHTPKQHRYASFIVSEATRLENILKDVLLFSWEPRLHFERIPLTETIDESVCLFADLCEEQGITIKREFNSNLPVTVEKEHVRQATINLVINAIDAMPGGGLLTVNIQEEYENDITYVAVHITDTGPGIQDELIPHVFDPFYTTKKIGQGTGLGLSISRKIITEHGGFIRLKNNKTGGVTASLYFPYQKEENLPQIPCWEYMKCGRDKDNSVKCPAYPHFGRVCWAVAGTLCAGKIQGTFAQKLEDCRMCKFYKSAKGF